jgi:glycerol-3-phosphate cytidylyltransferase-like family protein
MKEIYFPMSCRVLTVGHIKVLEELIKEGFVTVGLLTANALEGYKDEIVPFKDRKYILETVGIAIGNVEVIAQDSLDPSDNLKKFKYDAIASGDGFEPVEEKAAKKFKLTKIDVKIPGEKTKRYSSSKILKCAE